MISVVVCTYNRAESLRGTLDSLAQMYIPPGLRWELIVVDNNSTDHTREVVEEFAQTSGLHVRYVFEGNQGLAYARNTGIREAKEAQGEIIAFMDDDMTPDEQWLANLRTVFDAHNCMGVGGRIIPKWNAPKPSWLQMEAPYGIGPGVLGDFSLGEEPKETRIPPWGGNMAFRREAFERYGHFRTDLGLVGTQRMLGEDTEFGRRLIKAGEKIVYTPLAVVYHRVDQDRLTKAYVLSYYFNSGRTAIREEGWPEQAVCYFGVPRYLFRSCMENFLRWMVALNGERRFYHKLQVYMNAGEIFEAYKLARGGV